MNIPYHLLFQAIIEQTGEGIALANEQGNYVLVNPALCQMTGYAQYELLRLNIRDLLVPGAKIEIFPKILGGEAANRAVELKRKDGDLITVDITGYPVQLDNQKLILGIVRDITLLRKQAIAIQKSEDRVLKYLQQTEQLHQVVDQLNRADSLDEIYETAVHGILSVLEADRASLLIFGDDDRPHFKAWHDLSETYRRKIDGHCPWPVHQVDAQPIYYSELTTREIEPDLYNTLIDEGIGALLFVPLSQPDRLLGKFMVYYNTPHQFTEQELHLAQVIAQNLSAIICRLIALEEMQQATVELRHMVKALAIGEETIAQLAEYNQSIIASAPIGIVTVNLAGKITSANESFIKMVGSPGLAETLKLDINIPALKAAGFDKSLESVLLAGKVIAINHLEYTTHWGKTLTVNFKVVPQKQQDGRITGAIIVIDDVTAHTQAEKLQTAVYRIAQAADKAKTQDELFSTIHAIVKTVMFADNFYIALINKAENCIEFPYYIDEVTSDLAPKRREFRRGITEHILGQAKPQLVTPEQFNDLLDSGSVELFGTIPAIYLGVPLIMRGEPIGVMAIQHYRVAETFGERELQILEYVATQVAQTIDRKQKEAALQKSEAQFRLLAENFREALIIYDRDLKQTIYANHSTLDIFGIPAEEVMDQDIETILRRIVHPDDWDLLAKARQKATKAQNEGNADTIEFRICRPDGEVRWLHQYSYPSPTSPPSLLYIMLSDITERWLAEKAQQESEEKMRSLARLARQLEQARSHHEIIEPLQSEIQTILGYKNTWIYLIDGNKEFMHLLTGAGFTADIFKDTLTRFKIEGDSYLEEIVNSGKIVIVEDAESDPRTDKELVSLFASRTIISVPILLEKTKLGSIVTGTFGDEGVRTPTRAELDYLEAIASHVAVVVDRVQYLIDQAYTKKAIQESNEQLQRALAELKETQENMVQRERLAAVGQLAAGIAHDFNNIMAVIVLYSEMGLRTSDLPEGLRNRLQTILREAWRATELVQQILDFSRRAVLEPKPMELVPFLKEQVKLLERTLPENIRLNLVYGQEPYVVHVDPTRIQQIVMNLIVNARDAMPHGGDLKLQLNHTNMPEELLCAVCQRPFSGDWIKLTIEDNGSGIAPETLPHIFEPFFTTKQAGQGSGLGLSQVAGIVDQHGGHMRVESQLNSGTVFTIYFPTIPLSKPEILPLITSEIPKGNQESLLIVEDEKAIRDALADTVTHLNYQVITAENGVEALEKIKSNQTIDLVLSDLVMPEMGGQALFQAIQIYRPDLPVIMLSGYPLKSDLQNLQQKGLAGWLLKPPDIGKLAQLLSQVLAAQTPITD